MTNKTTRIAKHLHIIRLKSDTMLGWSEIVDDTPDDLSIVIGDSNCNSIGGYIQTSQQVYAFTFFTVSKSTSAYNLSIDLLKGTQAIASFDSITDKENNTDDFLKIFKQLPDEDKQHLFIAMVEEITRKLKLQDSEIYAKLLFDIRKNLESNAFEASKSYWISQNALYFEGEILAARPEGELKVVVTTKDKMESLNCRFTQLSEKNFAFIAVFPFDAYQRYNSEVDFAYITNNTVATINSLKPRPAFGKEFINYLNSAPNHHRSQIREIVCSSLVDFTPDIFRAASADVIRKLQFFVKLPALYCNDADKPFNLHFDKVIPIGSEGVFASGWMRDPLNLLESITIHSALGFSYEVESKIFRTSRPDVEEGYKNSPYGGFSENNGFAFYTPLPADYKNRINGLAELHSLHFVAKLKGDIEVHIHPEIQYHDAFSSRDYVVNVVHPTMVNHAMVAECIAPAARLLQEKCTKSVDIREVYEFKKAQDFPIISIIITLYDRLDMLRTQFAKLANDISISECELIFVLDSPNLEAEARIIISEYSKLYNLPAKLIVLQRNYGYAAAINTGVEHSNGQYILTLDSDVIPISNGWLVGMYDFSSRQKGIGILSPKLLYDDNSLQHAGKQYSRSSLPEWTCLSYHKGYPSNYALATVSRPVPAVSTACAIISSTLWKEVGGLSTGYIIGGFEDSDLSLKLTQKKLTNWYLADVELYHLERQSFNFSNNDNNAWRCNAIIHNEKWNPLIQQLMTKYSQVQ